MVSAAQNRSTNTSLHGQYKIPSCSGKSIIPTYNSPGCSSETARPSGSMINADGQPTTSSSLWTERVHLSGGGPKKRRGGAAGGTRKRGKADMYDDVETLLSDIKSPIFTETANIKGVLLHPRTKEAVTGEGEGEIYAFEYMTSEELATTAAAFRVDGAYGRYDVDWLRQALEASALRTAGAFDEHDAEQFEKDWAEEDEGVSDEEVEKDKESKSMGDVEVEKNKEESESVGEVVEKINSPMDKDAEPMEEYVEQPYTAQMQ
ncbi:asx domain-containing protein [Rutstroemia sp. NJR-2017a BBW]|nr:asx domain-containing protein [Rutstroemia sp. NJR-2017a BBW]